ncbi:ATP-dependent nuclease subunit B [Lacticaseibacillus rhamnosus]|nr:ATP-dependent nuclease subunit B [Lacticaseibacillus rhamnosus]MCT3183637.1 ATP-dependent nuclease subunit B [Lacticaseibacillus rhamnosus]MCT4447814.1 ATP-dependent nuclease subunit B [Lacticaseibacillus rhamnosus]
MARAHTITRSPAQKSACKGLGRNGQSPAITPKAAYTPIPNRAGSRSYHNALPGAEVCV